MTKNRSMRIAVLVLALALITCCFVGTTFAKYTSTATGSSTAVKVADWSFTIGDNVNATGATKTFTFDPFTTIGDDEARTTDDAAVKEGVAPGTGGVASISLTNTSDVDASYTVTFSVVTDLPLEFSDDGGSTWKSVAEISSLNKNGVLKYGETAANINLDWRWAFEGDNIAEDDVADTAFGVTGTATAQVTATVVVTQLDARA